MDKVIIKKSDNIDLVDPEIPDEEIRPDVLEQSDWKNKFKMKKRRFRSEPDGAHEQLWDGMAGERNQFRGMGSDNSWGDDGEPAGW